MAHLKRTITIHAPVDKVYTVAHDPKRWPDWFVGMGQIDNLTGQGGVGTVAEFSYKMAGMSFPVTIEVTEDDVGSEGGRWKGKIGGPLAGEQTWSYAPKDGDTELTVHIEYTMPGKALGKIADRLIVERAQERSADQTLENLKRLCEAD
jgi:uncharacterized membrane protein